LKSNSEALEQKVLFITPPFTQLNTPYPATAYLKGFLNTINIPSFQADLGIEVILSLFSKKGLTAIFQEATQKGETLSGNSQRILDLQDAYIQTIDTVISFLHDTNPTLVHLICERNYLPEASRFEQLEDLEWAFGTMGIRDKARHFATLYLEDISDLIIEAIDPHFGFSRYAERLGRSASTFDQLHQALLNENTYIDLVTIDLLSKLIHQEKPTLVALSAPFPGNLYSAFKCGQWIKKHFPTIKIVLGGGYANTELRSLKDTRVFEFIDFITLDDGERPLQNLLEHVAGKRPLEMLKRTYSLHNNTVQYYNGATEPDYKQKDLGTPDYSDLPLKRYLSVIELANPMHRLWNDGRWNKLTLAHGCYWGKCTFCDISLDYIKTYEAATAKLLVDRIEQLIEQTGNNGFHFVDEAAPPALMRDVALEILRRKITVVWWTNIRFEKSFSYDLCRLLARSGCIAVSGGLEVASDRLLKLIDKGVTVQQVAQVTDNFTQAGIMVHAYLMYGFPTQTAQETIDSLEMVRQLFELGIVQSGFWHQFALTAHSPIGLNPKDFNIKITGLENGTFANNDLEHADPTGADHSLFSAGLKKSLFNYMHGIGFDMPLHSWFDFKTPRTLIPRNYIERCLDTPDFSDDLSQKRYVWIGPTPRMKTIELKKKGKVIQKSVLQFNTLSEQVEIQCAPTLGNWIYAFLQNKELNNLKINKLDTLKANFENHQLGDFESFYHSSTFAQLRDLGMLVL
jgi:radical SAM superfamily enzyme YgiQ (UPF0313 family)